MGLLRHDAPENTNAKQLLASMVCVCEKGTAVCAEEALYQQGTECFFCRHSCYLEHASVYMYAPAAGMLLKIFAHALSQEDAAAPKHSHRAGGGDLPPQPQLANTSQSPGERGAGDPDLHCAGAGPSPYAYSEKEGRCFLSRQFEVVRLGDSHPTGHRHWHREAQNWYGGWQPRFITENSGAAN